VGWRRVLPSGRGSLGAGTCWLYCAIRVGIVVSILTAGVGGLFLVITFR